ncbi:HlyD family type I secretion periplasmic adaptor subunit [Pseudomonas lalucatii]|uniref:Membrane fusion protein (MFP) family protein n=1 Tax=Pseudomonas lalucatii TaxID=1424203 RepID=A0ABS5PXU2_9PSED|nr:HlyD family type I secretion periplasmic adaptor subunit [Pseudomonas lalucatii]MBS7661300.1 HlyD family type I secretion periplasmic adaptor subunit [Pseudomonas lalucatii]MBS7691718.1 HlyD family type I secretion periplasmic adaptor subunit [Pseudomonas lalucatii]MBS7724173.1 HlyD family type I secretion periplasmic adaptor subunit [Pseudomonas lalucatii]QVM87824.1 HlyD family type I secretion periplasmic adaptor subunit [Pseudomonas lalucatii]
MSNLAFERKNLIPDDQEAVDVDDRRPGRWGLALVLAGFGGFVLWAILAPLDAGVVANATVNVTDNRKTIQHLDGGSIKAIAVREGEMVRQGQTLVELDATRAIAEQGVVSAQYIVVKTVENRLQAERDGLDQVTFDPALLERFAGDPRLNASIALQQRLFATRRAALTGEAGILEENIRGAEEQLKGLRQVQGSRYAQIKFLRQELEGVRSLAAEGYVTRNRMLELERNAAELNAALAQNIAEIGGTRNQIAELKLRILQLTQDFQKEVQSLLTDAQKEAAALADRLRSLDYQVANTVIRSPIDGVVLGLNVSTIGGVIQPGSTIMDVVPAHEPLQVDAMVPVQAIDKMAPGLPVDITFPAFNHAQTPNIPGRVLTISADRLVDEANKQPYYLAQVEVTPEGMDKLGSNRIRAGMPATVTIKTGERNLMSYLMKPMLDRIDSAFKEQ